MTIIGTSHFVNFTKACDYYRQGEIMAKPIELERIVRAKIEEGEIHLGKPDLKPGQRLLVIDDGCRYAVETTAPFTYYVAKRDGMYELRQTRFEGRKTEHPHDVCAVARTVEELRGMVVKHFAGLVDWRGFDERTS